MKTVRLIKRHEMPPATNHEIQPVAKPEPRPTINHWMQERQRSTPTTARRAFAALFTSSTEQMSY